MNGKDLINNIVRVDMPDIEQVRENCHRQAAAKQQSEKRLIHRPAFVPVTVAALVVCLIVGSVLFSPHNDVLNAFTLSAYAMEHQEDGSIVFTKVLPTDRNEYLSWGGFHDGENLLMSVNLKFEGENIEHINFYIDDGFFAKQYLKFDANGKLITDGVSILYIGESRTVASYGQEYEIIGSSFTLSKDDFTDDLLLFVGREDDNWGQAVDLLEKPFVVRAVATFNDGKAQEERLAFDYNAIGAESGGTGGIIARHFSDEEVLQMFYDSTDMEKMEQAFINEAHNQNIGEVRITNIDIHNFNRTTWAGYWMITFDLLPEGQTEWLLSQTQVVQQMSTDPETRDIVVRFYN